MGQPRGDDRVEVVEEVGERLGLLRCMVGECGANRARLDRGAHGPLLEGGEVVGDPVDELVTVASERLEVERTRNGGRLGQSLIPRRNA